MKNPLVGIARRFPRSDFSAINRKIGSSLFALAPELLPPPICGACPPLQLVAAVTGFQMYKESNEFYFSHECAPQQRPLGPRLPRSPPVF